MNLKRILAATDFSALGDAAIHRAIVLAAREESELVILHAMPKPSVLDDVFGADGNLPARMRVVARDRLAALVDAAMQAGARRVRAEIAEGSARRALADTAESFHPDLLVIGAHGKGLLQQFFLGGTASRILVRAACPVLVVRREPAGDYRQTLAAVDLGPRSEAVLRAAIIVAARGGITAAHAYQAPFEAKLRYKRFFVVGLKLDLQHIRHIGPVALATGLGQLSFTIVIGFLIILAMGKGWVEALYVPSR